MVGDIDIHIWVAMVTDTRITTAEVTAGITDTLIITEAVVGLVNY